MNGFGILVEGPVKMIGNWYCGKLYGEGTFENQVTGEKYSGQWNESKKEGRGVHTTLEWLYQGEFKNDEHISGLKVDLKKNPEKPIKVGNENE